MKWPHNVISSIIHDTPQTPDDCCFFSKQLQPDCKRSIKKNSYRPKSECKTGKVFVTLQIQKTKRKNDGLSSDLPAERLRRSTPSLRWKTLQHTGIRGEFLGRSLEALWRTVFTSWLTLHQSKESVRGAGADRDSTREAHVSQLDIEPISVTWNPEPFSVINIFLLPLGSLTVAMTCHSTLAPRGSLGTTATVRAGRVS